MTATTPQQSDGQLTVQYQELAELAGALAHEIKNPLSVIRMNMDLLAEDLGEIQSPHAHRMRQRVGVVKEQCSRLERLLQDFLRFVRVRHLDLQAGDLNQQVRRVLALFEAQAAEQGVHILPILESDLPVILMDPQLLQAALVNLVKNALEAMPDGGQLTVITRTTRHGVALDLIDTGCGMDEETALRMFDAFYSTKEGGTGLGLPTARKIIEAHGGRIDVQSARGHGTKFTLEFPTPPRI